MTWKGDMQHIKVIEIDYIYNVVVNKFLFEIVRVPNTYYYYKIERGELKKIVSLI